MPVHTSSATVGKHKNPLSDCEHYVELAVTIRWTGRTGLEYWTHPRMRIMNFTAWPKSEPIVVGSDTDVSSNLGSGIVVKVISSI